MISNRDRLASALLSSTAEQDWMDQAACRPGSGHDPELWWPLSYNNPEHDRVATLQAIDICWQQCPVRRQCLEWAVQNRETGGIWGGLTVTQRYHYMRGGQQSARYARWRELQELLNEGHSLPSIAARFGIDRSTAGRWVRAMHAAGVV